MTDRRLITALLVCLSVPAATAGDFTLVDPYGVPAGRVVTGPGRLWVSLANGEDWVYVRDFRFDTPDGRYVGYFNATLARVLRYPRDGWGTIYRADFDEAYFVYTPADFRSVPSGISAPAYGYPIDPGYPLRLDYPGAGETMPPPMLPPPPALPASPRPRPLPPAVRSSVRVIDETTTAGPAQPPVPLTLVNPSDETLVVQVADALGETAVAQIEVPASGQHILQLPRRGDDVVTKTIESISPQTGLTETRTVSRTIQSLPRYNVSVARRVLRSIAIDRTGKDPQPISDVRFEDNLLGEFLLPPDPAMRPATIDLPASAAAYRLITIQ